MPGRLEGDGKYAEIPKSSYKLWVIRHIAAAAALVCACFSDRPAQQKTAFYNTPCSYCSGGCGAGRYKNSERVLHRHLEPKENARRTRYHDYRCDVFME